MEPLKPPTMEEIKKTHWGMRIMDWKERGWPTRNDERDALSWITCACGRTTADIERNGDDEPTDAQLYNLGGDFAQAVEQGSDPDQALEILLKIETRAREVAAQHHQASE